MPKGDDNKPNWHDRLMPVRVWHSAQAQWHACHGHNHSSADSIALSRNRMGTASRTVKVSPFGASQHNTLDYSMA
jgi:hypothetical protein